MFEVCEGSTNVDRNLPQSLHLRFRPIVCSYHNSMNPPRLSQLYKAISLSQLNQRERDRERNREWEGERNREWEGDRVREWEREGVREREWNRVREWEREWEGEWEGEREYKQMFLKNILLPCIYKT